MVSNKFLISLGMVAATALPLAACQTTPSSVPGGYAYQQGEFKSPPGQTPRDIGYPWSERLGAESAAHWRVAANDIVKRIVASQGVSAVPLYVEPSRARTPFTTTFDNFLREELIKNGFIIAAAPGKGPVLRYDATVVEKSAMPAETQTGRTATSPGSEVIITVNITGGEMVLTEVTGVYYIPQASTYHYREPIIKTMPVVGER